MSVQAAAVAAPVVATVAPVVVEPVVAPVVAAPVVPAVVAAPVVDPNQVLLPKAQLEELLSYKAVVTQLEADKAAAEAARKESELKAQLKDGHFETALQTIKKQADDAAAAAKAQLMNTESRAKKYALEGELARALAAQPLSEGSAEQLTHLWRSEFVAEAEGDSFRVRTPQTYQSVPDFVAAKLGTPAFAKFLRPSTQGGVGGNPGAALATPTPTATPAVAPVVAPAYTMMDQIAQWHQAQPKTIASDGYAMPSRDASGAPLEMAGFGLKIRPR